MYAIISEWIDVSCLMLLFVAFFTIHYPIRSKWKCYGLTFLSYLILGGLRMVSLWYHQHLTTLHSDSHIWLILVYALLHISASILPMYGWDGNQKEKQWNLIMFWNLLVLIQNLIQCISLLESYLPGNWSLLATTGFIWISRILCYVCIWYLMIHRRRLCIQFDMLPAQTTAYLSRYASTALGIWMLTDISAYLLNEHGIIYCFQLMLICGFLLIYASYSTSTNLRSLKEEIHYLRITNNQNETEHRRRNASLQQNRIAQQRLMESLEYLQTHYQTDHAQCQKILEEISGNISHYTFIKSDNTFLESFLNFKIQVMTQHNIKSTLSLQGSLQFLDPFDITILLGNLIDNAIEAQKEISQRLISISIQEDAYQCTIRIRNTCQEDKLCYNTEQKRYLSTKEGSLHGIGLENVKACVEKYHGSFQQDAKRNLFMTTLILPIPQKEVA